MRTTNSSIETITNRVFSDAHAHPALKTYLYGLNLWEMHKIDESLVKELFLPFDPDYIQTDLPKLIQGGVNLLFNGIHIPESKFVSNSRILTLVDELLSDASKSKFIELLFPRLAHFCMKVVQGVEDNSTPFKPFEQTLSSLQIFEDQVIKSNIHLPYNKSIVAKNFEQVLTGLNEGNTVFLHSIEGAHSLGSVVNGVAPNYINNLEQLVDKGLAMLTLSHFYENDISWHVVGLPPNMVKDLKCKDTSDKTKGLTAAGSDLIKHIVNNKTKVLIDTTHCSIKARDEIMAINSNLTSPLVMSHVGVDSIGVSGMAARPEELLHIRNSGGFIGLILYNYWLFKEEDKWYKKDPCLDELYKTIEAIHDITKTYDCVSIGSDFDGFTDPPDDIESPVDFYKIPNFLNMKGIPANEVDKIMGKNTLYTLNRIWN